MGGPGKYVELANPTWDMKPSNGPVPDMPYVPANTKAREFIAEFLEHLRSWDYCPPSDNIWTLEIKYRPKHSFNENAISEEKAGIGNLSNFYKNVLTEGETNEFVDTFFNRFYEANTGSCFLVQGVSFPSDSVNIDSSRASNEIIKSSGGLKFGKIVYALGSHDLKANIQFLSSNIDINDWLIDPWIKAVAKYGLIKASGIPDVTRDIYITQWCSAPRYQNAINLSDKQNVVKCSSSDLSNAIHVWRKQVILYDAIPLSRSEVKHDYEYNNAGVYKVSTVNFSFHDYKIKYNLEECYNDPNI